MHLTEHLPAICFKRGMRPNGVEIYGLRDDLCTMSLGFLCNHSLRIKIAQAQGLAFRYQPLLSCIQIIVYRVEA